MQTNKSILVIKYMYYISILTYLQFAFLPCLPLFVIQSKKYSPTGTNLSF